MYTHPYWRSPTEVPSAHSCRLASSLSRHVSYCRRAQKRPRSRRKACRACNAAKARCTFQTCCSRCTNKGLECVYEERSTAPQSASAISKRFDKSVVPSSPEISTIEIPPPATVIMSANSSFLGLEDMTTFPDDMNLDLDDTWLEHATEDQQNLLSGLSDSVGAPLPTESHDPFDFNPDSFQMPSSTPSLTLVKSTESLTQQNTNLILESLCAVPEQMLRRATFPSFIHPHWDCAEMPEALAICIHIAQMFASRSAEVGPFIWRTILAEQRRALEQVSRFKSCARC